MDISKRGIRDSLKHKPLRFLTCGSVDDGKSTLIGRLLWDTKSVKSDHASGIVGTSESLTEGSSHSEFANLLDGLQAEREQGITIDVAYRYFSSTKRSFIVADTPGHEQYTRNMVTGASTADLAVILIDAQLGVSEQTKRHALVASLMGIKSLILAINKMDLVGYNQQRFEQIEADFAALKPWIGLHNVTAIPVAAVLGHNIVKREQDRLNWYKGPTLLEALENADPGAQTDTPFRFNVQRVSRPDESFRGFQGTLHGSEIKVGDPIIVSRSNHTANVSQILTFDGETPAAVPGDAITIALDRKIDIARGDTLSDPSAPMEVARNVLAKLIVLDDRGLSANKRYWLKSGSHKERVRISARKVMDLENGVWEKSFDLQVNSICEARVSFEKPFFFDRFEKHAHSGSFILIDPEDFSTVAGGMFEDRLEETEDRSVTDGIIHVGLPIDVAREVLALASQEKRLNEFTIQTPLPAKLDHKWIKNLQQEGLALSNRW